MKKESKVISDKLNITLACPKSPFSGFFAFAQNDLQLSNRHAELVSASRGRSMVEMLGVLAIIGVLSIGSLVGVKFAFNAIKANNLLDDVRLYAAAFIHNGYDLDTNEFNPTTNYAYALEWIEERNVVFAVDVEEVPEGVCNSAKNKAKDAYLIQVNGVENADCSEGLNQMKFIFNEQNSCSENCEYICCDGVCCPSAGYTCDENNQCYISAKDFCNPKEPCGDGCYDPATEQCCNGVACFKEATCTGKNSNECCFTGATTDKKLCCNTDQTPCDDECCPSGTVCTNGVCRTAECYTKGSTTEKCTGSNCDCYIGENRCGTGCTADGLVCATGFCSDPSCPKGTKYTYHPATRYYGCETSNAPSGLIYSCTRHLGEYYCFNEKGRSCAHSSSLENVGKILKGSTGMCYENPCKEGWTFVNALVGSSTLNWCEKEEVDGSLYRCTWSYNGRYYCLQDGSVCASNCTEPIPDGNCSVNYCSICTETTCGCPEGMEQKDGKCYINENLYCVYSGNNGANWACKRKENGSWKVCGQDCNLETLQCSYGMCTDVCPEGSTYGYLSFAGCYIDGDNSVFCTNIANNTSCYKDGGICGTKCSDYLGTACEKCFSDIDCGEGTFVPADNSSVSFNSCQYPSGLRCFLNGVCNYITGRCGSGCNIDGTDCDHGKCICDGGETYQYYTDNDGVNYYMCRPLDAGSLTCSEDGSGTYSCQFGTMPCGTGCAEDGSNCSTGVCVAEECTEDTSLSLVTNAYFGCYSATNGTKCYRYGNAYVCYKNSVECGTGCNIDGTGCGDGQTCIVEE